MNRRPSRATQSTMLMVLLSAGMAATVATPALPWAGQVPLLALAAATLAMAVAPLAAAQVLTAARRATSPGLSSTRRPMDRELAGTLATPTLLALATATTGATWALEVAETLVPVSLVFLQSSGLQACRTCCV